MQSDETVSLLLSEIECFVRPMDYYMDRLEYSSGSEDPAISTSDFTLIVTRFGQPVSNTKVTMIDSPNQSDQTVLPTGAVSPTVSTKTTEDNGQVTFTFAVNNPIPMVIYENDPCPDYLETQKANDRVNLLLLEGNIIQLPHPQKMFRSLFYPLMASYIISTTV